MGRRALCTMHSRVVGTLRISIHAHKRLSFSNSVVAICNGHIHSISSIANRHFSPRPIHNHSDHPCGAGDYPLPPGTFSLSEASETMGVLPRRLGSLTLCTCTRQYR